MYFAGETPWHNQGIRMPRNARPDQVASVFPDVGERPIGILGQGEIVGDMKALISLDDGRYLATVGADYHVIQGREIANAVTTAAGEQGANIHTAGLLGERGNRGWILGEIEADSFTVDGDDSPIRAYFLGTFGHDGRTAVNLCNVSTRVVCHNTVAAALAERGNWRQTIRHTSGASLKVESATASFVAMRKGQAALAKFAQTAGTVKTSRESVMAALEAFLPTDPEASKLTNERTDAARAQIVTMLANSPTVAPAHRGTAWGLLCAMSEFAEHYKPARLDDSEVDVTKRAQALTAQLAERALFGNGLDPVVAAYATASKVFGLELPR